MSFDCTTWSHNDIGPFVDSIKGIKIELDVRVCINT